MKIPVTVQATREDRGKRFREWATIFFALTATILSVVTYHQSQINEKLSRRNDKLKTEIATRDRKAELESILAKAWDRMGGKTGTTTIAKISDNPSDLELARRDIEEVITKDPSNSKALRMKGVYLESAGDLKGAIRTFREAIELDKNSSASFIDMAVVLRKLGDRTGAIHALKEAEKIGTHNELVFLNLSLIYREQKMNSEADRLLRAAIELLEQKKNMLQSDVLAELIKYNEGVESLEHIRLLEPNRLMAEHPMEGVP